MKKEDALDKLFKGYYKGRRKDGPTPGPCYKRTMPECSCKPIPVKTPCPDTATISAYVSQSLDAREREAIENHFISCAACRESADAARLAMVDLQNNALPKAPDSIPPVLPPQEGTRP